MDVRHSRCTPLFKSALLAAALTGTLAVTYACSGAEAIRASEYELIDPGSLGGDTRGLGIAETGAIAGESRTTGDARRAIAACDGCFLRDLGTLHNGTYSFATAISPNSEWVVGNSGIRPAVDPEQFSDIRQGFVWKDNQMEAVGALYNPATFNRRFGTSEAHGVNDHGQVAGFSVVQRQNLQSAFLWENGVMTDIGLANEDGSSSRAWAINNTGQVVGDIILSGGGVEQADAFVWQAGTFRYLPHPRDYTFSSAVAINDAGQIAGWSGNGLRTTAVLWSGATVVDIGTLAGGTNSRALGINERGQVVGWSGNAEQPQSAFLWQAGVMLDLNTLLPPRSEWVLLEAADISNAGMITGTGLRNGALRAFVLKPPSPAAGERRLLQSGNGGGNPPAR
jgi:probable HAF family extracellular repeat protein